jgi:hypothetical protein
MPQYVTQTVGGLLKTLLQLDDGSFVEPSVLFPLTGGLPIALSSTQLTALQTPTFPSSFPIPSGQVTDLKAVTVGNFPSSWTVGNFPTGFNCSNLPASYPLPTGQESMLSGIQTTVGGFSKGSANFDTNTLRTVIASNQPRLPVARETATMTAIALSTSGDQTILTPTSTKALRIAAIAFTAGAVVGVQFKNGTVAQGSQVNLSGVMPVSDFSDSFPNPIALPVNRSFVINLAAAVSVQGYISWWEE